MKIAPKSGIAREAIALLMDPRRRRLAETWHLVGRLPANVRLERWAALASVPTGDAAVLAEALTASGICRPNGTLDDDAATYLRAVAFSILKVKAPAKGGTR